MSSHQTRSEATLTPNTGAISVHAPNCPRGRQRPPALEAAFCGRTHGARHGQERGEVGESASVARVESPPVQRGTRNATRAPGTASGLVLALMLVVDARRDLGWRRVHGVCVFVCVSELDSCMCRLEGNMAG